MKISSLFILSFLLTSACASGPTREQEYEQTKNQMAAEFKQHQPDFNVCYEEALKRNPQLKGEAKLVWTVNKEGAVKLPRITQSTFKDKEFEKCVVEHVKTIKFEPSQLDERIKAQHYLKYPKEQ